jgi:hypothetical protein
MNTDGRDGATPSTARTANVSVPPHRLRRRMRIIAASCISTAAVAALAWHTGFALPSQVQLGQSAMAGPIGRETDIRAQTVSVAAPARTSGAASGAAARAAIEVPTAITRQLTELKAAYERLEQQAQEAQQRIGQVEADLAALKQQFEKSHAAKVNAERQARELSRQLRAARTAATEPPAAPQLPRILSVDVWNGRPSVSVQFGSEVRFIAEGDTVADAHLRKADPATQRVEFVSASGVVLPAHAAAGEGR